MNFHAPNSAIVPVYQAMEVRTSLVAEDNLVHKIDINFLVLNDSIGDLSYV